MAKIKRVSQLKDVQDLIVSGGDVSIAVAYLTRTGLSPIKNHLLTALNNGRKVRFLIDLNSAVTEPSTLTELMDWASDENYSFEFKVFFRDSGDGIFHGKVFIASLEDSITFITGSYNLTGAALFRNLEHGLCVECDPSEELGRQTLEEFDKNFWAHENAFVLDDEAIRLYEKFRGRERGRRSRNGEAKKTRNELALRLKRQVNGEACYWLIKCNTTEPFMTHPEAKYFSFEGLQNAPDRTDYWGYNVNNPAARIYLVKGYMKFGDRVLFYHSSPKFRGVVGTALVVKERYNLTGPDGNTCTVIDIKADKELLHHVSLRQLTSDPELQGTGWASMNCILPVASKAHWEKVLELGGV